MKIQMDDGSEMEIPKGICPRCWIEVDREQGTSTKLKLALYQPPAHKHDIDKCIIWICPDCQHRQTVVVDNPDYEAEE